MTGCAELEKSLRECMDVPVCFLPFDVFAFLLGVGVGVWGGRGGGFFFFFGRGRRGERK